MRVVGEGPLPSISLKRGGNPLGQDPRGEGALWKVGSPGRLQAAELSGQNRSH